MNLKTKIGLAPALQQNSMDKPPMGRDAQTAEAGLFIQDYKSLCLAVAMTDTPVNRQTHIRRRHSNCFCMIRSTTLTTAKNVAAEAVTNTDHRILNVFYAKANIARVSGDGAICRTSLEFKTAS